MSKRMTEKRIRASKAVAVLALSILLILPAQESAWGQTPGPICCSDMWDPGWTQRPMWGPGRMGPMHGQRMFRHRAYMHYGVSPQYRGKANPLTPTKNLIGEGQKLYADNCASCHGAKGMGDGEAGKSLSPSPALLAYMIQMPMSVDEYLLWTISDGGKQFKTAMPAFKDTLTQDQIWKIILYMRAGFPALAKANPNQGVNR